MLHNEQHRRFLLCKLKPINAAQPRTHHSPLRVNSVDNRLSTETNAEVAFDNTNGIAGLFLGSFNTLNTYLGNNQQTGSATQLCNLLPWEIRRRRRGRAASGSTFWQFQYGFKRTCGWRDCCLCLENVQRDPAFIRLQRWLCCRGDEKRSNIDCKWRTWFYCLKEPCQNKPWREWPHCWYKSISLKRRRQPAGVRSATQKRRALQWRQAAAERCDEENNITIWVGGRGGGRGFTHVQRRVGWERRKRKQLETNKTTQHQGSSAPGSGNRTLQCGEKKNNKNTIIRLSVHYSCSSNCRALCFWRSQGDNQDKWPVHHKAAEMSKQQPSQPIDKIEQNLPHMQVCIVQKFTILMQFPAEVSTSLIEEIRHLK